MVTVDYSYYSFLTLCLNFAYPHNVMLVNGSNMEAQEIVAVFFLKKKNCEMDSFVNVR